MANFLNNRFMTNTYNTMFPWLNKSNYDKVIAYGNSLWLEDEEEKKRAENNYYRKNVNKMVNDQILDERDDEINQQTYQAWKIKDKDADIDLRTTLLSQELKRKYNLDATYDDAKLVEKFVKKLTPEWQALAWKYLAWESDEFLYVSWLAERPQEEEVKQWWIKALVNPADEDRIVAEKSEWINPIWATAETVDNAATKFADKWLDWWNSLNEWWTETLKEKLDNMSEKEVEAYRKKYQEMLKNKDWKTAQVEWDTIVEQLWNAVKWDLKYDYNDEDFEKWLIEQKTNLWEYIVWADDVLQWETNPNVIQFFGNIPSSALKTFTATVRGMTNPYDTLKWLYTLAATEEWHQALLDRYWSWDNLAKSMNTDPVWVADDMLAVAEIVGKPVGWLMKKSWNASVTKWWDRLSSIWSANDALAQKTVWKVFSTMDNLAWDNTLLKTANRYMQDVSNVQKLAENTKSDWNALKDSSAWQAIKNYANEVVDKLVWVSEEDRKFIRENKDLVNQYIDGKKSVEDVFDQVKTKINDKRLANTEMWKEYGNLRKNKTKVVDTTWVTKDMVKELKDNWIKIDKKTWDLKFDELSKYNAKQKRALQDAWNELKALEKAKKINASNVLDMRQKMDDKLNWDGKASDLKDITAVDRSTENLIKKMRWVIDERAKGSVKWLKELDEKFAPAMAEMEKIQKDWLNSDWTLKDTARSKLRNLTKAGNEERLARLEKIIPWITKDLQALDVWLTIDRATKQWVWQYAKQIITAWAWASLFNPTVWIPTVVVWILSNPKNYVKLMEYAPDVVEKISSSISKWTNVFQDLLPSDINRIQSLASRIEDGFEE